MTNDCTVCDSLAQLEATIQSQLRGRIAALRLVLREHGFVIEGRARSYYAKQLAQHAVMEQTELPIVANDIEVMYEV